MHVVEGISDRVVALDHGVKIAEGSFEAVATDPKVVEAYLGLGRRRGNERRTARPLLQLEGINTYYGLIHILQDVNIVGARGRARVPARRQRVREVDDAEDDPRDRPAADRAGAARRRGRDASGRRRYRIGRGIAIVPENRRLFAPMTVLENLEMGAYLRGAPDKEDFERVYSLFPLLYERRAQLAGTLSGGEQQMVAMARALMSRPKLMLMDEPSMGLAPVLVERNFEIIKEVHEAGVAILVVEQNANVSLSIADRGYVLSTGRLVLEGKAADLLQDGACGRHTLAVRDDRTRLGVAAKSAAIREFPILAHTTYLNSCSQGALSHRVGTRTRSSSPAGTRTAPSGRDWVERAEAARGGVRAAAARGAVGARRHHLGHPGRERDRLRARPAARGRRS